MGFFNWLFGKSPKKRKRDPYTVEEWLKKSGIKPKEVKIVGRGGVHLTKDGIDKVKDILREQHNNMENKRRHQVTQEFADSIRPGFLSDNTNWMFIQDIGKLLSPIGNDNPHTVTLTKTGHKHQNVHIADIACTNQVYSEWIVCCCETMWHTQNKVLYDIYGNSYPVGDMCEMKASITFR